MASATLPLPQQVDSIPSINLHHLSQSELYTLSLSSTPYLSDNTISISPQINPSIFNESAGTHKQTFSLLRLSPHLRSPFPHPNINDPQRLENTLIISQLKNLFSSHHTNTSPLNPFVPTQFDYTNSVGIVRKRKRGRPRKEENENVVVAPLVENLIQDIFICEDRDKDRVFVNKNGVVVDMVALGQMEDPFGEELRRRSEGMGTSEELLGFLGGLNGEWGSRRRRRIVEAGEFGDVLPNGWKILVSIKRKDGRVWLMCRRYISPSGRHFVSCKEVSSYLLSFYGLQDSNQPTCAPSNRGIQTAYEMASKNDIQHAADHAVSEDNTKENSVCHLSSPVTSILRNHEKQVTLKIEDPHEVLVGEFLNCHKCKLTFDGKDDLLQHQLLSHRRKRSKTGTCITDGVIIRSGQYECQFCHKTFNERKRYIGHIGAHVKNDVKCAKTSVVANEVKSVEADSKVSSECFDANDNDEPDSDSPCSIEKYTDKFDHDLNFLPCDKQDLRIDINELFLTKESSVKDESTDIIVTESNICLRSGSALSNNEKKSDFGTSGETLVSVAKEVNECLEGHERSFVSCSPSPLSNEQVIGSVEKNVIRVSASVEEPKEEAISGSALLTPSGNETTHRTQNMNDSCFSSVMGEFKLEENSRSDLLVQSCVAETSDNVNTVNEIYSIPVAELKFDGVQNLGNHELNLAFSNPHTGLCADTTEEKISSDSSIIPTGIEQACDVEISLSRDNNSTVEDTKQVMGSVSGLFSLSFNGETCDFENNFDTVYNSRVWEAPTKVDEVQNLENDNFMTGFGSSHGQPDEVPDDIWRSEENVLQSGLADISNPLVQSTSGLTFDIISNKGEDGLFRLSNNRNESEPAFEGGLRSGRIEPVEFSLLNIQNSDSFQGDPNVFSYDTEIEQEFDSSFWLGNDALMPNTCGSDQFTTISSSVCVWCRNEFHEDAVLPGTRIAIGPMCPPCRAQISEQVNVL